MQASQAISSSKLRWSRFPESDKPSEFWANLRDGVDMVTADGRRWPVGLHNTPPRFGKLREYERFDAAFFSVHGKQAQVAAFHQRTSCQASAQRQRSSESRKCVEASCTPSRWHECNMCLVAENGSPAAQAAGSRLRGLDGLRHQPCGSSWQQAGGAVQLPPSQMQVRSILSLGPGCQRLTSLCT